MCVCLCGVCVCVVCVMCVRARVVCACVCVCVCVCVSVCTFRPGVPAVPLNCRQPPAMQTHHSSELPRAEVTHSDAYLASPLADAELFVPSLPSSVGTARGEGHSEGGRSEGRGSHDIAEVKVTVKEGGVRGGAVMTLQR